VDIKNETQESRFGSEKNVSITIRDTSASVQVKNKKKASKLKLTFMLMMFSLSYLVTTLPVFIIIIIKAFMLYVNSGSENVDENLNFSFESEFAIAKTLMFANNSFNILFLILFGQTLRRDMLEMLLFFLCFRRPKNKREKTHNTTRL